MGTKLVQNTVHQIVDYICIMYESDVSYSGFAEIELIECDGAIVIYFKENG